MNFTGERPFDGQELKSSRMRYKAILPFVCKKKVLDFGCGVGYGSFFLDHFANFVVGLDRNREAIAIAKNQFPKIDFYHSREELKYLYEFQTVVAVESIEHLEKVELEEALAFFSKHIPEFVATTPNGDRFVYRPLRFEDRRGFHVWHYQLDELQELFLRYYRFVEILGTAIGRERACDSYLVFASNSIAWDDNWLTQINIE